MAEDNYIFPVFDYSHQGSGCTGSVTGGYVYRGALFNGLYGVYISADYCTGNVYMVTQTSGGFEGTQSGNFGEREVSSFGEDLFGELYIAKKNSGEIYKVTETEDCNPVAIIAGDDTTLVLDKGSIILEALYNPILEYQWYKDNESLEAEILNELEVLEAGFYTVHVTNPVTGCTNISAQIEITAVPTSVTFGGLNEVKVFPNPVSDILNIENLPDASKISISLFDSKGAILYNQIADRQSKMIIPTNRLAEGMYHLTIVNEQDVIQKKVIIKKR
jgi:hypothetical protein